MHKGFKDFFNDCVDRSAGAIRSSQRIPKRGIEQRPVGVHLNSKFSPLELNLAAPSLTVALAHVARAAIFPVLGVALVSALTLGAFRARPVAAFSNHETVYTVDSSAVAPIATAESTATLEPLTAATESVKSELNLLADVPLPEQNEALAALADELTKEAEGVQTASLVKESVLDRMGQIKFLAGMIAIHRPSIADCGAVAKDIVEISSQEGVDPFYVAAIISVESRFGSNERSKVGAMGLMQLMPKTADAVQKLRTGTKLRTTLTDPRTNIKLGVHYIKQLEKQFKGNRFLALAAYNWGPTNVDNVGGRKSRIPASVQDYASTVLERSLKWVNHYKKAEKSANSFEQAMIEPKPAIS